MNKQLLTKQQLQDIQIYQYILNLQNFQVSTHNPRADAACFLHVLFKAIPVSLVYLNLLTINALDQYLIKQITFFFIVIDFWFTKNYNGRRMLGIRWFYSNDHTGRELFQFQFRANQLRVGTAISKIFWLTHILYIILPFLYFFAIGMKYDQTKQQFIQYVLLTLMILSSLANMFLFNKGVNLSIKKRAYLKKVCGSNLISSLGRTSVTAYL